MKKSITLLLIDDDEDDRNLFAESAKEVDETIECILLPGCPQALAYLRDDSQVMPDFIFLDLRMPGHSGKRCLDEISKEGKLRHIPVIIYTTSTDEEDAEELKKQGASHFVSKPTNPEEIYYMISMIINEKWK
jgi:CheY-like chemotaxis protein